ncbi:MAG TPA: radical SAM protein [Pseudomonadota bacterium]|nr:radical SAM protein [Pseudomonadota bacterium]
MKKASFVAAMASQKSARLQSERCFLERQPGSLLRLPLVYPSPYRVGMSSLGYQAVFRLLNDPKRPEISAERAFLPDDAKGCEQARIPLTTYETDTRVGAFPAILFSVAYELEITGLFSCLELSSVPVFRTERDATHPIVICGGPLTFSNPLPLAPFVDAVLIGEAEDAFPALLEAMLCHEVGQVPLDEQRRRALLAKLAQIPGVWVPSEHGEVLPKTCAAATEKLPATSAFLTPHTELSSMFLIETERGCSRSCTYCVMRRTTNGGMRLVSKDRIVSLLPDGIERVGLVGAAVTDHPKLPEILRHIVLERRLQVGISSLRADRLTDELVFLLAQGGYRTLTVASDGASQRLRDIIQRKTHARHLLRAAELCAKHGMRTLKVYMMVGLPDETDEDIDELIEFSRELSAQIRIAYGIAPFVPKRNTPLFGAPFAGLATVERRLARLTAGLSGLAEVRPTSARWAFVEYLLAQGGSNAGLRAYQAHRNGGSFAAWRRAFADFSPRAVPKTEEEPGRLADTRLHLPVQQTPAR